MNHATRGGVRTAATVLAQVLALSGLAACSSSDKPAASSSATPSSSSPSSAEPSSSSGSASPSASAAPSGSASPSSKTVTITIKGFEYSEVPSVAPGTKITVENQDSEAHTVTADKGGAFDVNIAPGASATFTAPSSAGSYPFHCTYHGNMQGTLKVS